MNESTARGSVRTTLDALEQAWTRGDGGAFAANCAEDVDFVNLVGMYVSGRAAVAALHDKIFRGPYAGSSVAFLIERVRVVSSDVLVAIAPCIVDIPAGPVRGQVSAIATVVVVRSPDGWEVASFHNTKREATNPDHSAIMVGAVSK